MPAARCGHEPVSGLYFETLGAPDAPGPPLLFVHGGGATGACFRATLDGRAGWADLLAAAGRRCVVADWPGVGRSGGRLCADITYDDVVDAHRRLLRDVLGEPAVVVCHSMGGAVAWKLVELEGPLVAGVVAVAAAGPANAAPVSEVLADDGRIAEVAFADTGVRFRVDRREPYLYEDAYVTEQAIAASTRFPRDRVDALRSAFAGLPPRMLLQRLGVEAGLPAIMDPAPFAGRRIRLLAGDRDPAHTRAVEERTLAALRGWGADATLTWLPDHGIEGNGHFLFFEDNSDELAGIVERLIEEVCA